MSVVHGAVQMEQSALFILAGTEWTRARVYFPITTQNERRSRLGNGLV